MWEDQNKCCRARVGYCTGGLHQKTILFVIWDPVRHNTLAVPVFIEEKGVTIDAERVDVSLTTEANEMPEDFVAHTHIQAGQVTVHPTVHSSHQVTNLQRQWDSVCCTCQEQCVVLHYIICHTGLSTPFYSVLVSISVLMALSTVLPPPLSVNYII